MEFYSSAPSILRGVAAGRPGYYMDLGADSTPNSLPLGQPEQLLLLVGNKQQRFRVNTIAEPRRPWAVLKHMP